MIPPAVPTDWLTSIHDDIWAFAGLAATIIAGVFLLRFRPNKVTGKWKGVQVDLEQGAGPDDQDLMHKFRVIRAMDKTINESIREVAVEAKRKARILRGPYIRDLVALGANPDRAELSWWYLYYGLALIADQNHVLASVSCSDGNIADDYWFEKVSAIREAYDDLEGLPSWESAQTVITETLRRFLLRTSTIARTKHVDAATALRTLLGTVSGMPMVASLIQDEINALLETAGEGACQ